MKKNKNKKTELLIIGSTNAILVASVITGISISHNQNNLDNFNIKITNDEVKNIHDFNIGNSELDNTFGLKNLIQAEINKNSNMNFKIKTQSIMSMKSEVIPKSTSLSLISDTSVKTTLSEAKNALDNWVDDMSVQYENFKVLATRDVLIKTAKEKMDMVFALSSSATVDAATLKTYSDQLSKYFKALLVLEKTRNYLYFSIGESEDSLMFGANPSEGIEQSDLDLLYNQYKSFKDKYDKLKSTIDFPKMIHHKLAKKILDPIEKVKLMMNVSKWLSYLSKIINSINFGSNPNNIGSKKLDKFNDLKDKVTSTFTFVFNFFEYQNAAFVGNPILNKNKTRTPINYSFLLEKSLSDLKKGEHKLSDIVYTNLVNEIKELVAFNGLFSTNSSVENKTQGALSLFLKDPSENNLSLLTELSEKIKTEILPTFSSSIMSLPGELIKDEDLSSWSMNKVLKDLESQTKLSLSKFELVKSLFEYLKNNSDESKNNLQNLLTNFDSEENKMLIKSVLNTDGSEEEKVFSMEYLTAFKSYILKISMPINLLNSIDKIVVGSPDPNDSKTTVTEENINQLKEKYLNMSKLMTDGTDEESEISNLNSEVTNETLRAYVTGEFVILGLKNSIKQKIEDKSFEITINLAKNLESNSVFVQNEHVRFLQSKLQNPEITMILRMFAKTLIDQKLLNIAYNNYSRGENKNFNDVLTAFQTFNNSKDSFDGLETQKDRFSASEMKLFESIKADNDKIKTEYEFILTLNNYVKAPINRLKRETEAKLNTLSETFKSTDAFNGVLMVAKTQADALNKYWNNELDSTRRASNMNTLDSANALLNEVAKLTNSSAPQPISQIFIELQNAANVVTSSVFIENDLMTLINFNSQATSGSSFDTASNRLKSKDQIERMITNNINRLEAATTLREGVRQNHATVFRTLLDIAKRIDTIATQIDINSSNGLFSNITNRTFANLITGGLGALENLSNNIQFGTVNRTLRSNANTRINNINALIIERANAAIWTTEMLLVFIEMTNNILVENRDGDSHFDNFIPKFETFEFFLREHFRKNKAESGRMIPNLYSEDSNFWKSIEGANNYLRIFWKTRQREKSPLNFAEQAVLGSGSIEEATAVLAPLINSPIKAVSEAAKKLFAQFDPGPSTPLASNAIRSYLNLKLEENYRKYLGTYVNDFKLNIEQKINDIVTEFGNTNNSIVGSAWDKIILSELRQNNENVTRLKNIFRTFQKYIDLNAEIQLMVDTFVKSPTNQNRIALSVSPLWFEFQNLSREIEVVVKAPRDGVITPELRSVASDLFKLRDTQKNKVRIVLGFIQVALSEDLTKIDLEAIKNPYPTLKIILGDTFNLFDAIGAESFAGLVSPKFVDGSLFTSASISLINSDVLVYKLLNANNLSLESDPPNIDKDALEETKLDASIAHVGHFSGKNSSYLQMIFNVQRALINFNNPVAYTPSRRNLLISFHNSIPRLKNQILSLNYNHDALDTDERSLYNLTTITIPNTRITRRDLNIEQILSHIIEFLSRQITYANVTNVLAQTPNQANFTAFKNALKSVEDYRENIPENRSEEQKEAFSTLNEALSKFVDLNSSFDIYKKHFRPNQLKEVMKKSEELNALMLRLETMKNGVHASAAQVVNRLSVVDSAMKKQIEILSAFKDLSENPTLEKYTTLNTLVSSTLTMSAFVIENSLERKMVLDVRKAMDGIKSVIDLSDEYNKESYDGFEVDKKLLEASNRLSQIKNDALNNDFLKIVKLWMEKLLIPIQARIMNDKNLLTYVANLNETSENALNIGIIAANKLLENYLKEYYKFENFNDSQVETYLENAQDGVNSYIFKHHLLILKTLKSAKELYSSYKNSANQETKDSFVLMMSRVEYLKKLGSILENEMKTLASLGTVDNSKLLAASIEYNTTNPSDNEFGNNEFRKIDEITSNIAEKRKSILNKNKMLLDELDRLEKLEEATEEQISEARILYENSNIELLQFNILTNPNNDIQKSINNIIGFKIEAMKDKMNLIVDFSEYVSTRKDYAVGLNELGREYNSKLNLIKIASKLVPIYQEKVKGIENQVATLEKLSSRNEDQEAKLTSLKMELEAAKTALNSMMDRKAVANMTALQAIKDRLVEKLKDKSSDDLASNVQSGAQLVADKSSEMKTLLTKAGLNIVTNDEKFGSQALKIIEMLSFSSTLFESYYVNSDSFLSEDKFIINNFVAALQEIQIEANEILTENIFEQVQIAFKHILNDINAYNTAELLFSAPGGRNLENAKETAKINNSDSRFNAVFDSYNTLFVTINLIKSSLNQNSKQLNDDYLRFKKSLDELLNVYNEAEELKTSVLQEKLKENIVSNLDDFIKIQMNNVDLISQYMQKPSAQGAQVLLDASGSVPNNFISLPDSLKGVAPFEFLSSEIKETIKIMNVLANAENGITKQLVKMLEKEQNDVSLITKDEQNDLKFATLRLGTSAMESSIRERIIVWVDRAAYKKALLRNLNILDNLFNTSLSETQLFNSDVENLTITLESEITPINNNENASRAESVKLIIPDLLEKIEELEKEIRRLNAIPEATRSPEEKEKLEFGRRFIAAIRNNLDDFKFEDEEEKRLAGNEAQLVSNLEFLEELRSGLLIAEPEVGKRYADLNAKTDVLVKELQKATQENLSNKQRLRLLSIRKVFYITDEEVNIINSLRVDTNFWKIILETNATEIGTIENEIGEVLEEYNDNLISLEEKEKLMESRNKVTSLLKALYESRVEFDTNRVNLQKFFVEKGEENRSLLEFREYIINIVEAARLKSEIVIKNKNLKIFNKNLEELQSIDLKVLSNDQKEFIEKLTFDISDLKQQIINSENRIKFLEAQITKFDEKTISTFSAEDIAEHKKLVDEIEKSRLKIISDSEAFDANQKVIDKMNQKILTSANIIQDDKVELDKYQKRLAEIRSDFDENRSNLDSINFYHGILEIKFASGLGKQEIAELAKREADDRILEAAQQKANRDLEENRREIRNIEAGLTRDLDSAHEDYPGLYITLPNRISIARFRLILQRDDLTTSTINLYQTYATEALRQASQKVANQKKLISLKMNEIISELANLNRENQIKLDQLKSELRDLEVILQTLETEEENARKIDGDIKGVVEVGKSSSAVSENLLGPINNVKNIIEEGINNRRPITLFAASNTLIEGYINIFSTIEGLETSDPKTTNLTMFKDSIGKQTIYTRIRELYESFTLARRISFDFLMNQLQEYKVEIEKFKTLSADNFGGAFKKIYDVVSQIVKFNEYEINVLLSAAEAFKDASYSNTFSLINAINKAKKEFEDSEIELQRVENLALDAPNRSELQNLAIRRNKIAKLSKTTYELYESYYPILFKLQTIRNSDDSSEELLKDIEKLKKELELTAEDDAHNTLQNIRLVIKTQFESLKNRLKNRIVESEFYASSNKFTNNKTLNEFKVFDGLYQKLSTAGFSDLSTFNSIKEAIEATRKTIEIWEASNVEDTQGIEIVKEDIEKALTIVKKGLENTHDFMLNINTLKAMMSVLEFIKQSIDTSKTDKTKYALRLSVALENYSINRSNDNLVKLKNAVNLAQRFRISLNGADFISSLVEGINKLKHNLTIINVSQRNEQRIATLKAEHKELEDLQNDALIQQTPTGITKDLFDGIKIDLDNLGLEILLLEGTADGRAINEQLNSFINIITKNTEKATIASLTGIKEKILNLVNLTNIQKNVKAALNEKYEKISNEIMLRDMLEKITSIPKIEQIDEIEKLFSNSLGDLEPLVQLVKVSYENNKKFIEYQSSSENSPKSIKEMSENLRTAFQNTLKNSEILARSNNPYFSMIGIQLFRINEANNFLVNAESFLLEAIVSNDSEKMIFALDNFEKWQRSSQKSNQDYSILFALLEDWSKLVEESKDGNTSAINKLTNISKELEKLNNVSEVTRSSLNSIITELTDKPSDNTNIIIISVSSAVGFIILSIILYIWIKRRRVEIIRINQPPKK